MTKSALRILRNASRRPVELHMRSGVRILSPRETMEVFEEDSALTVLEKHGVLTRHTAKAIPPGGDREEVMRGKKEVAKKVEAKKRKAPTASKNVPQEGIKKEPKSTKSLPAPGRKKSSPKTR